MVFFDEPVLVRAPHVKAEEMVDGESSRCGRNGK